MWHVYALSDQGGDGTDHSWTYKFAGSEVRADTQE
jgi:hypothetical protein